MNEMGFMDVEFASDEEELTELLCKRDQVDREAKSILISYTKEFGDLITEVFELKVECIKKKKMIAFCQAKINRGQYVDVNEMNEAIDKDMMMYYVELKNMTEKNKEAKESKGHSEFEVGMAKKIYRRLAKKLHPDVNAMTQKNPKLSELWNKIAEAYQRINLEELENLEVMAKKLLEELGDKGFELQAKNLKERIERIRDQINTILTTEPYTYIDILQDEEKTAEKKKALEEEREEYKRYLAELTEQLEKLLGGGGINILWTMN